MNLEQFTDKFEDLNISEKIAIFNEYCIEHGDSDNQIFDFDDDFFNTFFSDDNKMEICRATCYGKVTYIDPYIRFNSYGNLESFSDYDAKYEIEGYIKEIFEYPDTWEDYIEEDDEDEEEDEESDEE